MSLRLRLTALYSALFVLAGGVLLTITYLLLSRALPDQARLGRGPVQNESADGSLNLELPPAARETLNQEAEQQRSEALHQMLVQSGVALILTTVIALVLGWLMAGRVLRPLRRIIDATHRLSPENLDQRIELHRPDDEFKTLATTMNAMLARLEAGFAFQRRFAANASHELRTPLTVQRSAVEVALADPEPSVASLQRMAVQVQRATERHERLIDSLLVLAHSQERFSNPQPVDLDEVADEAIEVIDEVRGEATADGTPPVRHIRDLRPACVLGDRSLLERLITNLVDNAVKYNVPHGWTLVCTGTERDRAFLEVTNTGPHVPPPAVTTLFEPFRRANGYRQTTRGVGLGLSIVAAVASLHRGLVEAHSRPDGGLHVRVSFPAVPPG